MLTTVDFSGWPLVRIRALAGLQLDDGRRLHTGEEADTSEPEAQRLVQTRRATFAPAAAPPLRSCSARRDELWKAGLS